MFIMVFHVSVFVPVCRDNRALIYLGDKYTQVFYIRLDGMAAAFCSHSLSVSSKVLVLRYNRIHFMESFEVTKKRLTEKQTDAIVFDTHTHQSIHIESIIYTVFFKIV